MNSQDLELRREAWLGGQLLAFSALDGPTDFQDALTARTAFDPPGIEIKLPGVARIRFRQTGGNDNLVAGDWFCAGAAGAAVSGAFLDTHHLLIEGPCEILDAESAIACLAAGNRTLVGAAAHFDAGKIGADLDAALRDRRRWLNSRPLPAGLSRAARRTLLKALSVMKTQVYRPAGRIRHRWTTPDRWPHRKMWLWDSAFHAIGWRHVDPQIAREAIAAVLDTQARDGFVAHMMEPESVSDVTQPPVLALAAKLVQEVAPDPAWIEELYPKLGAYIEWDLANRDRDGSGLVAWKISRDPHCRCDESGMDNSPRFDAATRLAAVDFNSYLALECEILAEFAAQLGRPAEAAAWQARQERLCRLIAERLWSEELRFFTDYDLERRVLSDVRASSGFLPLICGAATAAQAECLAEHLRDPAQFGTPFPVPSIAASDTAHYAKDMWRGPVWINLNWLIARGFARYGYRELAAGLLAQTAREIEDACEKFGVLFEFYDDRKEVAPPALLRKGRCAPTQSPYHQVFHDYGWTATLYADIRYQSNSL